MECESHHSACERAAIRNSKVPSRISVEGEFATSRPQLNSKGQAYLESFESDAGITVNLSDRRGRSRASPRTDTSARRFGANPFDIRRATLAFQNNAHNPTTAPTSVQRQHRRERIVLAFASTSYEQLPSG